MQSSVQGLSNLKNVTSDLKFFHFSTRRPLDMSWVVSRRIKHAVSGEWVGYVKGSRLP